jgi:hypothetical protein
MFKKLNLVAGILALSLFSYAQWQGWNLFEDVANSNAGRSGSSGRVYHK